MQSLFPTKRANKAFLDSLAPLLSPPPNPLRTSRPSKQDSRRSGTVPVIDPPPPTPPSHQLSVSSHPNPISTPYIGPFFCPLLSRMSSSQRNSCSASATLPMPVHRTASFSPSLLINANKLLNDRPQLIDCPRCKYHGPTELKFVTGLFSWVSFLALLVAGIFVLPLFFLWVPFFVDTFKDVEHYCPGCKTQIGTFHRLGK